MVRKLVLMGFIFTICSHSQAQKIPFKNYTNQNGLPQITVYDIEQDFSGYIWFATQVGAARFDGYEFEVFNTSNGLPDDFVNCLLVHQSGNVWMGTEAGIAIYDGNQVSLFGLNNKLVDKRVDRMIEDRNGNVWIATAYGLSVITTDTVYSFTRGNGLPENLVVDIFPDSKGRVHVATQPGLTIFNSPVDYEHFLKNEYIRDIIETELGEIWYASQDNGVFVLGEEGLSKLGYKEGLNDEMVLSLMQDHSGRIWCGTYVDGLYVYEAGKFRQMPSGYDAEPIARMIYEDQKHRIWIQGFEDGVWLYDNGKFKHFTTINNLVDNGVEDLYEDSFGNIWLATFGGVSKYGRVIFETYDMDFGLPENHVNAVFLDSKDRIWIGTWTQLHYKYKDELYHIDERIGFPENSMPLSFVEDHYHNIYIGTDTELLYFNGRSIRPVDIGLHWTYNNINSLLITENQVLWCGTDSGIYVHNGNSTFMLGGREGLVNPSVNDIVQFEDRVYCATEGGISVFDVSGSHVANLTQQSGLISEVCLDLTFDDAGQLWVATNRGVSKMEFDENVRVTNYNTENGLTSNSTYFVEFADSGQLWIGTERGINVFNTESGEIEFYGYDDGFYPLETNARAVTSGDNGELWIGTVSGLVHYNPTNDVKDHTPPDLILFPPLVEGEHFTFAHNREKSNGVRFPGEPALPYNKNSLIFNFTGIHTTIPSQNRFSYFLEGYEDDWSDPGTGRSAPYRKLPNGHYVFRVKAFNLDGVEVDQDVSFAFIIKPPFWKTIWFIILEVLAGLSLIYAAIQYRERQLIRDKRILESKVKKRTREIEDQKVEIEAQRDEISEQKNYVEEQRDQIAFQNKEITDSILYAKRIQQAVLPGRLTLERTLPEHFIMLKPRDIVSGDFYWVEEKNERVIVCAADCTGHGVPGAFMSLLGLTFLNEIVNKDEIMKAGEILNRLRTYIIRSMSHKHEEEKQGRDGMDLSMIVIDKQLNMLEYAGAYNPLVIVRNGEIIEYKADKMPIGKHVGEEGPFTNHKIDLIDQDMIYLFSDGFPDQFGGEKGSKFKTKPFKRLLQRISTEPVNSQSKLLESELKSWMGMEEQVDDILIMGIRYNKPI